MGEIMSMHMWSERRKEIINDTKKMVVQIAGMYKTAYSYYILQELRKEMTGGNEHPLLLSQRKWQSYGRPLQAGPLYVMGGSEHRKWRRRFCILQPDYTLEVYDSEEDFEAGNRPRFSRKHSSFQVVDNVDAHISQQIKDYMRDFGYITNNVSNIIKKLGTPTDASKRPTQHVLALSHPYKGKFFMAADTAVEKEKWLNSMLDASRQLEGIQCDIESQRKAFAFAIRQACDAQEHCGIKVNMSGTQEEIISCFITDYLSNGCKAMLQTKVKVNPMKKYKMWDSISRTLSVTVESVVEVDYPPVRRKAEEEAEALKTKMMASMPQISSAYETASLEIITALEAAYREDLDEKVLSKLPELATKMADAMSLSLHEVRDVFVSLADSVNRQINTSSSEFANNIDRYFVSQLDLAPRNPEVMHSVFQSAVGNKSPLKPLDEAFPKLDYSQHERELCVHLQKLLDSAICTFEILCGEAVHKNKGQLHVTTIAKIQGRVLKKLGYDNMLVIKRFLHDVMLAVTYKVLKHTVDSEAKSKMSEFEDFIPVEYAEFMPIVNVYRDAVMNKLAEEIRPGLAAGFKRLANDHFSMTRYQSCSTIDSRSSACSNTSDELASSSKHESSPSSSRPSPLQKIQPISSLVGDTGEAKKESPVVDENQERVESPDMKVDDVAQTSSENVETGCPMDGETGEVGPMDGETGESFQMDENGERIVIPKSDEPVSPTPESESEEAKKLEDAIKEELINIKQESPETSHQEEATASSGNIEKIQSDEHGESPASCEEDQKQEDHQQDDEALLPPAAGSLLMQDEDNKQETKDVPKQADVDDGNIGKENPCQGDGTPDEKEAKVMEEEKPPKDEHAHLQSLDKDSQKNGKGPTNNKPGKTDLLLSNGAVRQATEEDEGITDDHPPAPAPRKKHQSPDSSSTHADDHIEGLRECAMDPDIEKYNGVLEQIIHTGEEKLI